MSSAAEKDAIFQIMGGTPHPVIVELGAHIGEEYVWMRSMKPLRYLMVEPDPRNYEVLRTLYRDDLLNGLSIVEAAIDSETGFIDFCSSWNTESKNRASGSTRKPTGHLQHFPEVVFSTPYQVLSYAIDDLTVHLKHIDLLWCDIQGAERDMIEGGRATLAKTRYMMIEAEPEVELYEGQALKPEIIAMLPDWEIIKDFGYNLLMRNTKYAK